MDEHLERRRKAIARAIRRAIEDWLRQMDIDVHPLEAEILIACMVDVVEYAHILGEIELRGGPAAERRE